MRKFTMVLGIVLVHLFCSPTYAFIFKNPSARRKSVSVPLPVLALRGYRLELDPSIKVPVKPKTITYDQFEKHYGNLSKDVYGSIIVDTYGNLVYLRAPHVKEEKGMKYDVSLIAPPTESDIITFVRGIVNIAQHKGPYEQEALINVG